jgi:uncharacterized protein
MRGTRVLGICLAGLLALSTAAAAADGDAHLAAAAKRQDASAVRLLLKQRADVNVADAEGMTPLHWAAHSPMWRIDTA